MSEWLLIVILTVGGGYPATIVAPFDTEALCKDALEQIAGKDRWRRSGCFRSKISMEEREKAGWDMLQRQLEALGR